MAPLSPGFGSAINFYLYNLSNKMQDEEFFLLNFNPLPQNLFLSHSRIMGSYFCHCSEIDDT